MKTETKLIYYNILLCSLQLFLSLNNRICLKASQSIFLSKEQGIIITPLVELLHALLPKNRSNAAKCNRLRGLTSNSTGGPVKEITLPGSSLCWATYADYFNAAVNHRVKFRKLVGPVSNRFIRTHVSITGSGPHPHNGGKGHLTFEITNYLIFKDVSSWP